jgi:MFS family permease
MTPCGWLIDRIGAWRALAFMGFGSGLFVAVTGLTGLFALNPEDGWSLFFSLLIIRALMGAMSAPIYPASGRVVADWIPLRQRATVNGLITFAAVVGNACTYPMFGFLIDQFTWLAAFVIAGAITITLALLWTVYATNRPEQHRAVNEAECNWISKTRIAPVVAPLVAASPDLGAGLTEGLHEGSADPRIVAGSPDPATRPTEGLQKPVETFAQPPWHGQETVPQQYYPPQVQRSSSWFHLLTNRSLILLTLSYAAVGYFEYAAFFSMPDYLKSNAGLEENQRRICVFIINMTMALGMPLGGLLSDLLQPVLGYRFGRAIVPAAGMTVGALFLGAGVLSSNPVLVVIWFALAMAALGMCEGPSWATAIELGGRRGGSSAGIFNTGGNLLGSLAPPLVPWIGAQMAARGAGGGWGLATAGLVSVVGAALWVGIDPAERSDDPQRSTHE